MLAFAFAFALAMVLSDSLAKHLGMTSSVSVVVVVWYRYVFHTLTLVLIASFRTIKYRRHLIVGSHSAQLLRGTMSYYLLLLFLKVLCKSHWRKR